MNYVYAVQTPEELQQFQIFTKRITPRLNAFLEHLEQDYQTTSLPRCIVWTNLQTATHSICDIPIPAYTNDFRTVFCPDLHSWKSIYARQLDEEDNSVIRNHYETALTENHLLQILGHEFVHHSDLFIESAYEYGIWFEEGMCEYISRKFFLTDSEFEEAAAVNALLVEMFRKRHGDHSLEEFGSETYKGDYAGIFFEYWRSFLAVRKIIEQFNGNILAVFESYHQWFYGGCTVPLSKWFHLE